MTRLLAFVASLGRRRLLVIGMFFTALCLLAVFTNAPGVYVPDTRFENYWAGLDVLGRHRYVWDDLRSLGAPTVFYTPAVSVYLALTDVLNIAPWVAERLLHVAYLVAGGLGMVQVIRVFTPRIGWLHVFAGLIFMFNPLTTQFLLPSGIFSHYSLAPWLLLAFARGVRGSQPWRWAAVAALATFTVGALNLPSLVYASVPLLSAAVYFLWVDRTTTLRAIAGWGLRAGFLTVAVAAPGLVAAGRNGPRIVYNIATTELPTSVSRLSAWFESWRGLGSWLTYIRRLDRTLFRPEALSYFESVIVIIATFAIPLLALYALSKSSWRPRLLFGGFLVTGLVAMVGIFPIDDPFPLGGFLADRSQDSILVSSFRNGYKAGPAWAMGVAALSALAFVRIQERLQNRAHSAPSVGRAVGRMLWPVLFIAIIGLASFPFWTGNLYSETSNLREVPDYWFEAASYLNGQEAEGSVLVLPGANYARFRWGAVGDDIFDGLLRRTHAVRSGLTQGTTEAAELLYALDENAVGGRYETGVIPGVARRLGIRWVVVRNDLDWQRLEIPRPSQLQPVREDPGLELVATFGAPGQDVVDLDSLAQSSDELALPPVEIYEVINARPVPQFADGDAVALVSGGGEAWVGLGYRDLLDSSPPVAFTGGLSEEQLADFLRDGSSLRITDTNRRRVRQVTSERNFSSQTLRTGEDFYRSPPTIYPEPGSETVSYLPAGIEITSSRRVSRFQTGEQPANAFDHNLATAWRVRGIEAVGSWLRVDFEDPVRLPRLRLVPLDPGSGRLRVARVTVVLSGGEHVETNLPTEGLNVDLPVVATDSVTIGINAIEGTGLGSVGLAEVRVPGIDTRERIQLPDDVFRRAAGDEELAALVDDAPLVYGFDRALGDGVVDEEVRLARRFWSTGDDHFALTGNLRARSTTSDAVLDRLLGGDRGAEAGDRFLGLLSNTGANTVDGDRATAWRAEPLAGQALRLRFPEQRVSSVQVVPPSGASLRSIEGLRLDLGGQQPSSTEIRIPGDCMATSAPGDCSIEVPPTRTSQLRLTITDVNRVSEEGAVLPIEIGEVEVGSPWPPFGASDTTEASPCRPAGEIDGRPFQIEFAASRREILTSQPIAFRGCRPLLAHRGWQEVFFTPAFDGLVDWADLRRERTGTDLTASDRRSVGSSPWPGAVDALVPADSDGFVLSGAPYDPGWMATASGDGLGATVALDTQASWRVRTDDRTEVAMRYRPQRTYEIALLVATVALISCLFLLRKHAEDQSPFPTPDVLSRTSIEAHATAVAVTLGLATVGWLLGGVSGLILTLAATFVGLRRARLLLDLAAIGLGITVLVLMVEGDGLRGGGEFVLSRPLTEHLGRSVGLLVIVGLVCSAIIERASADHVLDRARSGPDIAELLTTFGWAMVLGGAMSLLFVVLLSPFACIVTILAGLGAVVGGRRQIRVSRKPSNDWGACS